MKKLFIGLLVIFLLSACGEDVLTESPVPDEETPIETPQEPTEPTDPSKPIPEPEPTPPEIPVDPSLTYYENCMDTYMGTDAYQYGIATMEEIYHDDGMYELALTFVDEFHVFSCYLYPEEGAMSYLGLFIHQIEDTNG